MVVNTGANLIIDGEIKGLHESPGVFVYEKQAIIPYRTNWSYGSDREQEAPGYHQAHRLDVSDVCLCAGWLVALGALGRGAQVEATCMDCRASWNW